jgi:hypothetical protein
MQAHPAPAVPGYSVSFPLIGLMAAMAVILATPG